MEKLKKEGRNRVDIRLNDKEYESLLYLCNMFITTKSNIVKRALNDFIEKNKEKFNKEHKKNLKEYNRERKTYEQNYNIKKFMRNIYFINNAWKRIYNISSGMFVNTGTIDMNVIKQIVDEHIKLYNLLPLKIKKLLKPQLEGLKKIQNKEYLYERLKISKMISLKK